MEKRDYEKCREAEREAERIALVMVCAECGGIIVNPWSPEHNRIIAVCGKVRSHKGFVKPHGFTRAYREGMEIPVDIANAIERKERSQMAEQIGKERAMKLAPYQGVVSLTKEQAKEVLRTIWPEAPTVEVVKAAMICAQYGLNPLMKHLYLVPFRQKAGGSKWEPILGIMATRLIASRRGRYTYIDGPRMMTLEEQERIFGEPYPSTWWAITIVEGDGRKAPGYGSWPKNQGVYGADKGNTAQNMAMIRSERAALDRLLPGEMPPIAIGDLEHISSSATEVEDLPEEDLPSDFLEQPDTLEVSPREPIGVPTQAEWSHFWIEASRLGLSGPKVHERLEVASVKDWLELHPGKTLDDALEELRKKVPGRLL